MELLIWERPKNTSESDRLVELRWCPLVQSFIDAVRCTNCPYAKDTSGECGYDC